MDFQSLIRPAPGHAKFADSDYFIWGASMVRADDGVCHLFYSRWRKEHGFEAWVTHCEIAHAVADDPLGPYRHVDVALPARGPEHWDGLCTHNPTVQRFGGRFCLYYMGNTGDGRAMPTLNWVHRNNQRIGVAVADSPDGPWRRFDGPVIDVTHDNDAPDCLMTSNPSVTQRPDGGFLAVYKAVGKKRALPFGGPVVHCVATADSPTGPFVKHPGPVFTKGTENFPAEDPFIWWQGDRYLAIVKDQGGHFTSVPGKSLALFESLDGLSWSPASSPLVCRTELVWQETGLEQFKRLERPQLWLEGGRPTVLFCAATTLAGEVCNVHIPCHSSRSVA